jgi:DNA-binding MarR family transcriptional regulator
MTRKPEKPRRAGQSDARRVLLHLTARARAALERAHANRQAVFATATANWSDRERTEFAHLLTKFVTDFHAATTDT